MTTVDDLIDRLEAEAAADADPSTTPDVGIIMGSDSDLPVMEDAYEALDDLGFAEQTDFHNAPDARFTYESYVVSAHRTPELMYAYGETATERGLDCDFSASMVARIMLYGLDVPTDLATTSATPRVSSTARIGPPAITPVPGGAARRTTLPAP